MMSRSLLVAGYVKPAANGELVQFTGGIAYDYRVARYFEASGWQVRYCHFNRDFPRPVYLTRFLVNLAMMRRYRDSSLDLILADEGGHQQSWLFNRWAKRRMGARLLVIVHHLRCRTTESAFWRAVTIPVERRMLRDADLIVANSRHTISEIEWLGIPADSALLAPPGLSVARTSEPPEKTGPVRKILLVGNVEPRKGVKDAIEGLSNAACCEEAELLIVGRADYDPAYASEVMDLLGRRGLTGRVSFLGQVDQERLEELYAECDLFLLPSHWEGYGMVIAEAMARGLPVLTTSAGAIEELVEDGRTGLIVSPGDTSALSESLSRLCGDRELRSRLARSAHEASRSFPTWEETCRHIYERAMSTLFAEPVAEPGI